MRKGDLRGWFERGISAVMAMAAIVIATSFAHREFGNNESNVVRGAARPPERAEKWAELLRAGFLVGDSAAPVKIVEFGDFECPFCGKFEANVSAVRRQFGSKVALVFINFPLQTIHRFALPAARAAECARRMGRFGDFHDALFAKQDSLGLKSWTSYAIDAGIRDTTAFGLCIAATVTESVPSAQTGSELAARLRVTGTPGVFINGWRYFVPPQDSASLADAVTLALSGKPPRDAAGR